MYFRFGGSPCTAITFATIVDTNGKEHALEIDPEDAGTLQDFLVLLQDDPHAINDLVEILNEVKS